MLELERPQAFKHDLIPASQGTGRLVVPFRWVGGFHKMPSGTQPGGAN
jgi:hypothetical protein